MMCLDFSNQSNIIYSDKWNTYTIQQISSVTYDNEYSETKNNTDSSKCFTFEKHSEYAAKESTTGCLIDKRLSDSQVSKTRLEDNLDNRFDMI